MTRIESILVKVRDTLNDKDADRWSNQVLLRLLYDACCDVAKEANVLRKILPIQIRKGRFIYKLPEDLLIIKAIVYGGKELPIKSTEWLAQQTETWRKSTTKNQITHIVYDKLDSLQIQVFPRPLDAKEAYADLDPTIYGTDTGIEDYSLDGSNDFGVISNILDSNTIDDVDSPFGIITDMNESDFMSVIYVRRPKAIDSVNDSLEFAPLCDSAFKYYVAGMALRNDLDVQNRQMASEELDLYQRELNDIRNISSQDKVTVQHHQSTYNGMG